MSQPSRSTAADHVHRFKATAYTSSEGSSQQDNAPCHEARRTTDTSTVTRSDYEESECEICK